MEKFANVVGDLKQATKELGKNLGDSFEKEVNPDNRLFGNEASKTTETHSYDGLKPHDKVLGAAMGIPKGVLDSIYNGKELKHYLDLGMVAKVFDKTEDGKDRYVLVPKNLDMNTVVDNHGRTNLDRAGQGLSLIKDGKILEVHHIGQAEGKHYALLTKAEHTQNGFDRILHNPMKPGVDHGNSFMADKRLISKSLAEG